MTRAATLVAAGAAASVAAYLLWRRRANRAIRSWPHGVEVRRSRIPNAGHGLFAARDFATGELLGVYRGRVLSLLQAHQLEDRDYLMGGFGLNAHVDARFALSSEGRYVNDHFDRSRLNAEFHKDRAARTARLVASRRIRAGEEIYASYGETYWRARGIDPDTGLPALPAASRARGTTQQAGG